MVNFMNKFKGFTLVELMVTVAVIGILSAIAIPSYQTYVQQSKAMEASSVLSDLRIKMEIWYQDNKTYVGGSCAPSSAADAVYFSYSCTTGPTATTYTITATGNAAAGMSDYSYSIDQSNIKTSKTPTRTSSSCWVVKDSDPC